jgi:predicted dehydrogenase
MALVEEDSMNIPLKTVDKFKVGIIGAGLQGGRRAPVLTQLPGNKLIAVADLKIEKAKKLADQFGGEPTERWQDIVERDDINIVLVCTPPHLHAEITTAALNSGKHVLCEKPLTRTINEAEELLEIEKKNEVILKCGFNHRHHPGISKAKDLVVKGMIGEIDFVRCTYGICGRPGYEKEWRADPKVVSGGQLMEQGIHGIDLFRWFLGDFTEVTGFTSTRYWNITPFEDNAFALFRTSKGQIASLHSSLTQWKNQFTFEVYGHDGYIVVEGLGGGYGTEKVTFGKKLFYQPFEADTTEYRGADISWTEEWKEFTSAISENREPIGNGNDGLEAIKLVNAVYDSMNTRSVIKM